MKTMKFLKLFENFIIWIFFLNSMKFLKVLKFYENFEFKKKIEILRNFRNFEIKKKFENFFFLIL